MIYKFRGITTDTNTMIYGNGIAVTDNQSLIITLKDGVVSWREVKPETIGQYVIMSPTGAELYEGDIVGNGRGKKVVEDDFLAFIEDGVPNRDWFSTVFLLGNIHENPELLKQ